MTHAYKRREKIFGLGKPATISRTEKAALMRRAHELSHRTEAGRAYGRLTAKAVAVLRALLYRFHGPNGVAFPSYEAIAEAAGCARSTVHLAIRALERAGLLTWRHRLKRVREAVGGLFGPAAGAVHVQRASNLYAFPAQPIEKAQESEKPTGTSIRDLFSLRPKVGGDRRGPLDELLDGVLARSRGVGR